MADRTVPLLETRSVVSGYGRKQVVNGVSLDVWAGEVVAIIGHNGAGKSTLLKVVFGLLPVWDGEVLLDGESTVAIETHDLLKAGVVYVPQGNRVFGGLSVKENLEAAGTILDKNIRGDRLQKMMVLFPTLKERLRQRAETLSGGEKQMLALASALIHSPRLLLVDEPSLGLAPGMVQRALQRIREVALVTGAGVLIVEQKVREVIRISQRVFVLRGGRVSFCGPSTMLTDESKLRDVYL